MNLAPQSLRRCLSFAPTVAALLLFPWSRDLSVIAENHNAGILFLLAAIALPILSSLLEEAGSISTASASKPLEQVLRAVSFQIPLGFAILTGILAAGSLNLFAISFQQAAGYDRWLIFQNPFNMLAFFLSCIAIQGSLHSKSAVAALPYSDLVSPSTDEPEAAPRLPAQARFLLLAALQTSLWLGAWYDPFGLIQHLESISHHAGAITHWPLAMLADALGIIVFLAKSLLLLQLQNLLAYNLPRYRFDEVLHLGQKILLPVAAGNLLAAAAYLWIIEPLPAFQADTQIVLAIIGSLLLLALIAFMVRLTSVQHHCPPSSDPPILSAAPISGA